MSKSVQFCSWRVNILLSLVPTSSKRLAWKILVSLKISTMLGINHKIIRMILGQFSPTTIINNVLIILVVLKIILSDFPVVCGVLRVTECARKNVGGAPIANRKYSTC